MVIIYGIGVLSLCLIMFKLGTVSFKNKLTESEFYSVKVSRSGTFNLFCLLFGHYWNEKIFSHPHRYDISGNRKCERCGKKQIIDKGTGSPRISAIEAIKDLLTNGK
jgi:hypothetical protein